MKKMIILAATLFSVSATASPNHTAHDHGEMNHAPMDHSQMGHSMEMSSAVGMPAPGAKADTTVDVVLTDEMRIHMKPLLNLKQGDVVKFKVVNTGKLPHEFSVGSITEQKAHREMMRAMPDMHHEDGSTITLAAGESGELTWHFMGEKFVEFACNIPGHSEAGMRLNAMMQ